MHTQNWFTGTLLSRRNRKTTPMLMIAQRLHPDDLVGHVRQKFANSWHFVKIPLIEDGATDTIWPESYSYAEAMQLREVDPFAYYSQYQQEPIIPGGSLIKSDWWRYWNGDVNEIKKRCDVIMIFSDTAYGVKDANDYSVFQCWGFEGNQRMYLLDQIRGKWGYEQLVPTAIAFWDKHAQGGKHGAWPGVYRMYIENKASGQSLIQQHQLFRDNNVNAFPWNAGDYGPLDKVGRVKECLLPIYNGQVILPGDEGEVWVDDFVSECSAFSEDMSQSHDDQADTMTMAILTWRGLMRGVSVVA